MLATWTALDATPSSGVFPEARNGFMRWYDPMTGRWLSKDRTAGRQNTIGAKTS